jgi:hypothetical protein
MTAGYFGKSPAAYLYPSAFSLAPSLFVRLLFSSQIRILWALLAHLCPFFLLFTVKQVGVHPFAETRRLGTCCVCCW